MVMVAPARRVLTAVHWTDDGQTTGCCGLPLADEELWVEVGFADPPCPGLPVPVREPGLWDA